MAREAEKVAVSLDRKLLAEAERLRKGTGESRSALVARALRQLLMQESRSRRIAEYVDAYQRVPETATETRAARRLARSALADLPWDDA